jgi:hypothetical protein
VGQQLDFLLQKLGQDRNKPAFINKTVNKQVVILDDDEEESPILSNKK